MSILDPQLPQNRVEFDRWSRRKLLGIPITLSVSLVWVFGWMKYSRLDNDAFAWVAVVPLAVYGAFVLYAEYRKTMIFRRDLKERRQGSS